MPSLEAFTPVLLDPPEGLHDFEATVAQRLDVPNLLAVIADRRRNDRRAHARLGGRVATNERRRDHRERRRNDRRGFERLSIELAVEERVGTDVYFRVSHDLSVLGLAVRHATPHPPRTLVQLRFTLPDADEGREIVTYGLVTGPLSGGAGMRVKFVALDAQHAKRISRFIARNVRVPRDRLPDPREGR